MNKDELLAEIEKSRRAIGRDFAASKQELNFSHKAKVQFLKNPFPWLGGAAVLGWLVAGPRTRTKVVKVPFKKGNDVPLKKEAGAAGIVGILLALLRFAVPLLKPAITAYAAKQFAGIADGLNKR